MKKVLCQNINLTVILLHPGLTRIQILLPKCHLLSVQQTSVPVAACADLPAASQVNCQLASKHTGPCAAKFRVLLT